LSFALRKPKSELLQANNPFIHMNKNRRPANMQPIPQIMRSNPGMNEMHPLVLFVDE